MHRLVRVGPFLELGGWGKGMPPKIKRKKKSNQGNAFLGRADEGRMPMHTRGQWQTL